MFVTIIFALSLLIIWADWVAYRRFLRYTSYGWLRWGVVTLLILSNALPYIAVAMMWLLDLPTMVPTMWVLTVYTVLSLSRLALYVGLLLVRHRYARWILGGVFCVVALWVLLTGVVRTRKEIEIRSVDIASCRIPRTFDGYRIALFSDMHLGSMTSAAKMCRDVVEKINSLNADLVIFAGDLVNVRYEELTPELASILGGIKARDGVVAVLGNHDTGVYERDTVALPIMENTRLLIERIEEMGWRVVDDSTESIVRGCDTITLTGIGFSRELLEYRHSASVADSLDLRPIYEGVPRNRFNITVSHMPQLWRKAASVGYGDLVLSGHVHSMQVKLPLFGREYSPAQLMYREWSGLYEENGHYLYINDGIGSVGFHLRIGAPPEITEIILREESH